MFIRRLVKVFSTILFLIVVLVGCGRKRKTVFLFPDKSLGKINRLDLPAVRGIRVVRMGNDNSISWLPVSQSNVACVGYNVYRLSRPLVVAKKPLNKNPIKDLFYSDPSRAGSFPVTYYLIRAVFNIEKKQIEGPVSSIAGVQK